MTVARVLRREWMLLASATAGVLGLLALAASMPTICAAGASCTPSSRFVPAVVGGMLVVATAVLTAVLARRSAGIVSDGVRRSEGVVAVGTLIIGVLGVGFALAASVSAGFLVVPHPW